jgi:RimJ/RimL family protein N-acetyltransferase
MQQSLSLSRQHHTVEGERLLLRTLTPDDASEEYAGWLNNPVVNKYLETQSVTIEELKEYIRKREESDEAVFFGIYWKETGKHIGNIKLEPIDFTAGTAFMGILIGDQDYWGKGVGTEVTNLINNFAFDVLGMKEIHLGVISENKPAIRVYEKCGYEIHRIEEKTIDHEGVLYDKVCMAKKAPSPSS